MSNTSGQEYIAKFKALLDATRQQLLHAQTYFDIWKDLWPTAEVVDVINRYVGFFQPVRFALRDQFFIRIFEVMSSGREAPSLYRILSMVRQHPELAPGIDIKALYKRLTRNKDVLKRIWDFRRKRAAHFDTEVTAPLEPVSLGEISQLSKELQNIFNEIHRAHTGSEVWAFRYLQHSDVLTLLQRLK